METRKLGSLLKKVQQEGASGDCTLNNYAVDMEDIDESGEQVVKQDIDRRGATNLLEQVLDPGCDELDARVKLGGSKNTPAGSGSKKTG